MRFLLLSGIFAFTSLAHASSGGGGGDHVNNGGGLAEQNFIYAYQNIADLVDPCLNVTNECRLTEKERKTIAAISFEAIRRKDNSGLVFKSGRLNPGLFETDEHGRVRVAVTGLRPNAPIYVNLDLIYSGANGSESVIDVYGALSILVHELGHHTGETDHLFLDQLGNKVRGRREPFAEMIDLKKHLHPEFRAIAHNEERTISEYGAMTSGKPSRFTLENGHQLWDLTEQLNAMARCAGEAKPIATHLTNLT